MRALCAKHGVAYPESPSLYAALGKHVQLLYQMGAVACRREWARARREGTEKQQTQTQTHQQQKKQQ